MKHKEVVTLSPVEMTFPREDSLLLDKPSRELEEKDDLE
jgi:hypothetical protein